MDINFPIFWTLELSRDRWPSACLSCVYTNRKSLVYLLHRVMSQEDYKRLFTSLTILQRSTHFNLLLEKLIITHLVKKFCTFYGTQRFLTVFTRPHHRSLL